MSFHWLRDRRRKKLLESPFPTAWLELMRRNIAHCAWLDGAELAHLCELVQVFVAEKTWVGCGGLDITDEIRVTIAADACLLVLALPHDLYRNVDELLIYPRTVVTPPRKLGLLEIATAPVAAGVPILGEAHRLGPIILTWDAARRGARHPERGHNVVFHEFAHAIDLLDGAPDGTPTLATNAEYARWVAVCRASFATLRDAATEHGARSVLDPYGATNEAEFFAVATEAFFNIPHQLRAADPRLYEVLAAFYRQDPATRVPEFPTLLTN